MYHKKNTYDDLPASFHSWELRTVMKVKVLLTLVSSLMFVFAREKII